MGKEQLLRLIIPPGNNKKELALRKCEELSSETRVRQESDCGSSPLDVLDLQFSTNSDIYFRNTPESPPSANPSEALI